MKREIGNAIRLDHSPLHLLHRAGQCAGDIYSAEMSPIAITPRQFAVLATVAGAEGLSQTELVVRTGIDRSTLADIVGRMLRKGLLHRRRTKDDARAYAVRLTEEGRRIFESAEPIVRRVDGRLLETIPEKRRQQFLEDLAMLVELLNRPEATIPRAK